MTDQIGSIVFGPRTSGAAVFPLPGEAGSGVATVGGKRAPDYPGLTKRELFAALVLQGLSTQLPVNDVELREEIRRNRARDAVAYADALITALNATPEGRDAS